MREIRLDGGHTADHDNGRPRVVLDLDGGEGLSVTCRGLALEGARTTALALVAEPFAFQFKSILYLSDYYYFICEMNHFTQCANTIRLFFKLSTSLINCTYSLFVSISTISLIVYYIFSVLWKELAISHAKRSP